MENKYHGTWTINKLITGGYWIDLGLTHVTTHHLFRVQYSLLLIHQCSGSLKGLCSSGHDQRKQVTEKQKCFVLRHVLSLVLSVYQHPTHTHLE